MKFYLSLCAVMSFAITGVVYAHAHLEKSQPAANSTISALPKNLVLEFNEAVQVTALTVQIGDGETKDLGPLPKTAAKEVTVTMPAGTSGNYIVKWRGVSDDNHVMSGKLLFKVEAVNTQMK